MKMNYWLILGVLVATGATAQTSTNLPALPAIPAPANTTPAVSTPIQPPTNVVSNTSEPAKPAKKKAVKKKKPAATKTATKKEKEETAALLESTNVLVPGPAEVIAAHLNMRGQAGLKGEVVGHVQKGDMVTVVSEITLDKHHADEPAQWAKVLLPNAASVWVRSSFIDETNKTVIPKKLNLRGGPGENYSVLGVIERGTPVVVSSTKGDWSKIETPTNAYAFIAAIYLKQEGAGNIAGNLAVNPPPSTETMPAPVPTPVNVSESQPINTTPNPEVTPPPTLNPPPVVTPTVIYQTNVITVVDTNVPPPPPRIVTHDGYVRSSVSPVAPTFYELYDPGTDVSINYLFSSTTNLDLSRYKGYHITVTGEEGMDARWRDTPVLTVQKIYVVSTNGPAGAPTQTKKKKSGFHLW